MKRRTLVLPKPAVEAAERVQDEHGVGLSDLIRFALAEGASMQALEPYFTPSTTEVQLQLNDSQWQRIEEMTQQAQQAGLGKTQADVLRALAVYQLDKFDGGPSPGGP